jgi:hypothetical protein
VLWPARPSCKPRRAIASLMMSGLCASTSIRNDQRPVDARKEKICEYASSRVNTKRMAIILMH